MKHKQNDFFKFCPVCGEKLVNKKQDHLSRQVCSKCDYVLYQNSKPTVSALIVNNKKEILLVKRGIKPKFGYLDTPGGFLENDEEPIVGLKREMMEELGVKLKNIKYQGMYLDTYFERCHISTLNILYEVEIASGKLTPMDDVSELHWFSKKKIPYNKIAFKWAVKALKEYIK